MKEFDELQDFIKDNNVKFIRLSYIDLDGTEKNVAVVADNAVETMRNGVVFEGESGGFKDYKRLKLVPDFSTLHILPWRPQQGRVARFFSFIIGKWNQPISFDSRRLLLETVKLLEENGLRCSLGTNSEFYLFKCDDNSLPTKEPFDHAGYFDVAPLDKGENVRREICLTLDEMGISPLASYHEKGPGQNQISFKPTSTLKACDNYVIYKSVVKAIASVNGLYASFMPKPLDNTWGNNLSITLDVLKDDSSIFQNEIGEKFIAGVLNRSREITLFFNSIPNSFERLGRCNAPESICFEKETPNCFATFSTWEENKKLVFNSMDNSCNIYILMSLILRAGLEGINNDYKLEDFKEVSLPHSFNEAISLAENSEFVKEVMGEKFLSMFLAVKKDLAKEYQEDKMTAERRTFERI